MLFREIVEEKKPHFVGYLFTLFRDANKNNDDVIITNVSLNSISLRIEYNKEGIFKIEDDAGENENT